MEREVETLNKGGIDHAVFSRLLDKTVDNLFCALHNTSLHIEYAFHTLLDHLHNVNIRPCRHLVASRFPRLRQEDGFQGLIVNGKRCDIGLPDYYLETLKTFRTDEKRAKP